MNQKPSPYRERRQAGGLSVERGQDVQKALDERAERG